MNKTKNNKKYKKKPNKTLGKRKQNTRRKISGGRLLGQGSYGVYYGMPPMPCIPGTTTNNSADINYNGDNYVTKIFENPEDADNEYEFMNRIQQSTLAEEDLGHFFVLPVDRCNVDKNEINTNITKYSDAWKRNKSGQYYNNYNMNPILKRGLGLPISDGIEWVNVADSKGNRYWQKEMVIDASTGQKARFYSDMKDKPNDEDIWSKIIIYPVALHDLAVEFNSFEPQETYELKANKFIKILSEMVNISNGIELLQDHGFIHGDIKAENCLVIEENDDILYKIGDLSFLTPVIGYNPTFPTCTFSTYYCWPLLSVYSYYYQPGVSDGPFAMSDPEFLNELIKNQRDVMNNLDVIREITVKINIKLDLIMKEVNEIFKPYLNYANKVLTKIFNEKHRLIYAQRDLINYVSYNGIISQTVYNLLQYYSKWDIYFNSLGKEHAKVDLYERIDVYSFGFMLLKLIYKFLDACSIVEIKTDLNPIVFIVKLFILIDMCCIQEYDDLTPRPSVSFSFINEKFEEAIFTEERGEDLFKSLQKLYQETLPFRDLIQVPPTPPPP